MSAESFDAGFYDDLDGAFAELWRRLVRGAADRRSGFHAVQLATLGLDGAPRVRTVVLRGADREARALRVHTDARSGKIAEIAAEARVEVCCYDAGAKIQVRAGGLATAFAYGPTADAAWRATRPQSRVCYRSAHAPGVALGAPDAADPTAATRAPEDPEDGRDQFRVVMIRVDRLDWLYLAARGHRRARFDWSGEGWRGRWIAP